MSQPDQDKTEQPTPHHLEQARQRGEIAKSADVSGSLVLVVFAAALAMTVAGIAIALADATRRLLALAGNAPELNAAFVHWTVRAYGPVGQAVLPLVLALLVTGLLGNLLQTGPMFTAQPLKPDFKRMNPANALRRIFSMRTLWELGKMTAKFLLLGAVCAVFAWKARGLAEAVIQVLPQRVGALFRDMFVQTSLYVLLVLGLVAVADLLFTRREYMRKMRMSRREVRDEVRRRDGDPAIKSKRRQQSRELLRKTRALARVHEADVVLTNPTHVAVALRYRPGKMLGPVVIAKGAGSLAAIIRRLAGRHQVPVMRLPVLARALYKECEIDHTVPEALYGELAPVYRTLWKRKGASA
ncbi:flagellar biosynthesis protein FlhB [Stenotrophomonas pavanii]|uniref:EscU/YscU/HrcU family type III secretion system export apparatus switch protein n=1 Tax=Stenotrophomonas pavanii TaxID=487698 RepID=UPI0039C6A4EB